MSISRPVPRRPISNRDAIVTPPSICGSGYSVDNHSRSIVQRSPSSGDMKAFGGVQLFAPVHSV
ncbi:hypothetical protein [Paenibacillus agricola]|uniref:hypothetical protein n=1 Tax=Paenibacillus agricola TaxID=2716264 RepID=UPI001A9CEFCE|nr:hypothetical protein [Paenibacillus agricola]